MVQNLKHSFEGNSNLRLTDQPLGSLREDDAFTGCIGVDQHDLVLEGPGCAERIHQLDLGIIIIPEPYARILKAPVAGAKDDLDILLYQFTKRFGENQIPADQQTNATIVG